MKWTFNQKPGSRVTLKADIRARITNRKQIAHTVTLSSKCQEKLDNPEKLCFGISNEGIFTTPESVGTQFPLNNYGKKTQVRVINSCELTTEIFKHCNESVNVPKDESKFIDFNLKKVDENVWQLIRLDNPIKQKWGFK